MKLAINYKIILWCIIVMAFVVRMFFINYGLPLWLIGDEPPFITAALKMMELKTIFPFLHQEELSPTLYFPPYLSYLYLLPFSVLFGIKYFLFSGTFDVLKNYIVSDLSHFFILARFINILFGTATVLLVYKIAKNIFKKELVALFSSFFLASSTLHIYLSSFARDWVPAVFLFTLSMWILSREDVSFKKKYLIGAILSGIAFGVSLIGGFIMLFMLFWYLFYEHHRLIDIFKEKTLYFSLFIFLFLAAISMAIYPFGFHLSGDNSLAESKSIYGYILSLVNFLKPVLISEPILVTFSLLGIMFSWKYFRNYFWVIVSFIFSYITIFYIIFHYEHRFTIYLFPLLAISAGYGAYFLLQKWPNKINYAIICLLLFIPLATSLRLDWLAIKNDSRIQAREWAESNIPENSKVLVRAEMMRLASTKEAISEQKLLDPKSLRQIDKAEMAVKNNSHGYRQFHALNVYDVVNYNFYKNLWQYTKENDYKYIIFDPFYRITEEKKIGLDNTIENSSLIKDFGQHQNIFSILDGNFGSPIDIFKLKSFGPKIEIYKINYEK